MTVWSWLTEPFTFEFFGRALLAGLLVGVMCGALGVFVILRRMAYIGHGLSYGVLGGVALASLGGFDLYAGAAVAAAASGGLIDGVRRLRGLGADAAIAIVSTTLFAIGVAVISADRSRDLNLENLLFGNVLGVDRADLALVALAAAFAGVTLFAWYKPLVFATFDPEVARVQGVRLNATELVFNLLVGVVVIVSLRVVGVLLITAVLVLPAAVARLACRSFGSMLLTAAGVGAATSTTGLYVSYYADLASGPAIVLAAAAAFTLTAASLWVVTGRRIAGAKRQAQLPVTAAPTPAEPRDD